jgi:EpsG family
LLPYWLLFSFFAAGSLMVNGAEAPGSRQVRPILIIGMLLAALLVGLRYEVGADWEAYEHLFRIAGFYDLDWLLKRKDPGYQFLNRAAQELDAGIWLVNLVCAAILSWGLYRLARQQPWPWLAVMVAIPYLIIVVANGYTRQAVAIGILMAGLANFTRSGSVLRFAIYIAAAALFHKTVVVALLLVVFGSRRNAMINTITAIAAFLLFYDVFLEESVDYFYAGYIETSYSSQGTAIRLAMNMVATVLVLWKGRQLAFSEQELKLWRNFAFANIGLTLLFPFFPSSTVIDRLALYLIPIQIAALPRTPLLFKNEAVGRMTLVAYCFAVLFTWLNFASHAEFWLPYQFYPLA